MKATFKIWYVVWVSIESSIVLTRRTKKAARAALRDLRHDFPTTTFGMKRLLEPITARKRRSRRTSRKVPHVPDGFTIRTKGDGLANT